MKMNAITASKLALYGLFLNYYCYYILRGSFIPMGTYVFLAVMVIGVLISANEEPILCFQFQDYKAYGFNVWTDDGMPCFFFCIDLKEEGKHDLLTVLVSAPDNAELQNMMEFVEEYLSVE